jgi:transposase-like protein
MAGFSRIDSARADLAFSTESAVDEPDQRRYRWRGVDHEGEVLDMLVQRRRDSRKPPACSAYQMTQCADTDPRPMLQYASILRESGRTP